MHGTLDILKNSDSKYDAIAYYDQKSQEFAKRGVRILGAPYPICNAEKTEMIGMEAWFHYCGETYVSIYIFKSKRGSGRYYQIWKERYSEFAIITEDDCELEAYLRKKEIPFALLKQGCCLWSGIPSRRVEHFRQQLTDVLP